MAVISVPFYCITYALYTVVCLCNPAFVKGCQSPINVCLFLFFLNGHSYNCTNRMITTKQSRITDFVPGACCASTDAADAWQTRQNITLSDWFCPTGPIMWNSDVINNTGSTKIYCTVVRGDRTEPRTTTGNMYKKSYSFGMWFSRCASGHSYIQSLQTWTNTDRSISHISEAKY